MSPAFVGKICEHFENITDPRVNRGKNFPLIEMVFVALCGAICDCNSWVDVASFGKCKLRWFRKFLPFEKGVPSHDTFTELFARLDTLEFYSALESWARSIAQSLNGETVAFDGKTLRSSFDNASSKSALHSVSAWVCGLKMCIALKSVEDKSNEIPAVQQLIDMLDLAGAVITADAMHCQRETADKIIAKEADFVLMVKGNQESLQVELQQAIIQAFDKENPDMRHCKTTEKNRNRRETREVTVLPVPKDSTVFARWPGVKTIGSIYRTREINGKFEESQESFIASLPCKVRAISQHLRLALEHRELSAPCARCNVYRRRQSYSQGKRSGNNFRVSQASTQYPATRHYPQSEHSRQTQTLRLERGLLREANRRFFRELTFDCPARSPP